VRSKLVSDDRISRPAVWITVSARREDPGASLGQVRRQLVWYGNRLEFPGRGLGGLGAGET